MPHPSSFFLASLAGHEAILAAWEEVVEPAARRFRPDIILVSAGYDAHWADPLAGEGGLLACVHNLPNCRRVRAACYPARAPRLPLRLK